MIDSDVANLYECETKYVNRVMRRNENRFPDEEFCFQLTEEEYKSLRCQFVTLNKSGRGQHRKYMPYVYTEQGISMLSPLLNSDIAVGVSINIIRAFIEMRKFMLSNAPMLERLTTVEYKLLEKRIWIGASAGSCILSPTVSNSCQELFDEDIEGYPVDGLGLVDFQIMPHLNNDWFPKITKENIQRETKNLKEIDGKKLYAIDDDSAIFVNNGNVKVVSEGIWFEI